MEQHWHRSHLMSVLFCTHETTAKQGDVRDEQMEDCVSVACEPICRKFDFRHEFPPKRFDLDVPQCVYGRRAIQYVLYCRVRKAVRDHVPELGAVECGHIHHPLLHFALLYPLNTGPCAP